jgi:peroxiredoxin
MASPNPHQLPADLPVPQDDGAARHLPGMRLPAVSLPATTGGTVRLDTIGNAVMFCYPRTGRPGMEPPGGEAAWNAIPGARGCTPQVCGYRDHAAEIRAAGYEIFGISTQSPADQREAVERLGLSYPLLSDERLELASALSLPTFEVAGETLLRRLTVIVRDGRIAAVRYPVFPPDTDAAQALSSLPSSGGTPPRD